MQKSNQNWRYIRVNPPLKEEMLLISFLEKNTSKRLILGKLIYQPTNLKTFNEKFLNIKWNINDDSISLQTKNLYKLYSEIYTKPLYAPKIKSWENSKIKPNGKDVFIDFDGNGKAEMIAITDQKNRLNITFWLQMATLKVTFLFIEK